MWRVRIILVLLVISSSAHGQEIFQKEIYFDSDSTVLKEVIHFKKKDSTLHGTYESFHLNGSLQTFGHYLNGQPDSVWVYYYQNGRKRAKGRFTEGRTDGKWTYYYENGNEKSSGILRNDVKHGTWTFYYESGKPKSTGTYYNDKKSGIWNYFYEDEILKAQAYYEEGSGLYKEFYPSGTMKMEGENKDEKSEGEWSYYYESGELQARGDFKSGLRVGEWIYYHPNGEKAAVGKFIEGHEDGVWKHYFEDGSLSAEGSMESGEKDGFWKLYYPTGEVKGEADYNTGDGEYIEYYPSGKRKTSGQILDGKKHGSWVFYSEEGLIDGKADFSKGEGTYTGYYPDGSLKMKGDMKDDRRVGEWELYNTDGTLAGTYKPIYENEAPIFKTRESESFAEPSGSDKPQYLFKNKKIRYFTSTINEYQGVIVGGNPAGAFIGKLPIALEFYQQERLGYELQFILHRDPFFTPEANIPLDNVFTRGGTIQLRQKFYHPDRKLGMWYFGHLLGYGNLTHSVRTIDENLEVTLGEVTENRYYYGIIVGDRWMQRFADSGFTVDGYVGLGIGRRTFTKNYTASQEVDSAFRNTIKDQPYFPVLIGLNIGFIGPKRRLTK